MQRFLRCVILLSVLLRTTGVVWARDRELSINSSQIMGFLNEPQQVEMTLKDGSMLKGRTQDVDDAGVTLRVSGTVPKVRYTPATAVVEYREIKILRIVRPGSGAWRTLGSISGVLIGLEAGGEIAGLATKDPNKDPYKIFGGALAGAVACGVTGWWLGGKHKTGLTLRVTNN